MNSLTPQDSEGLTFEIERCPQSSASSNRQAEESSIELARLLGAQLQDTSRVSIPEFLHRIAGCAAALTGSLDAIALRIEDGEIFAGGTSGGGLPDIGLLDAVEHHLRISEESGWALLSAGEVDSEQRWALPLQLAGTNRLSGCLVCTLESLPNGASLPSVFTTVSEHSGLLAAAIEVACHAEVWHRSKRLHGLLRANSPPAPSIQGWDSQDFALHLREIFSASSVEIFVAIGEGSLQLTASDPLESDPPGRQARRYAKDDLASVALLTEKPQRSPQGGATSGLPAQLAVQVRAGTRPWGVLQLTRTQPLGRFTRADEASLQDFADRMGAALASWLHSQYFNAIMDSDAEAIAVTRQARQQDGMSIPRIYMVNRGMQTLLGRQEGELVDHDAREMYAEGEYERLRPALVSAVKQAKETGQGVCGPLPSILLRKDQSKVPVRISFRLRGSQHVDPPVHFTLAVAHDQTESEARAQVLEAMNMAYFKAASTGKTLESSKVERDLLGYSLEELQAMDRKEIYADPLERARVLESARKSEDGIKRRILLRLRRKNGDVFLAECDLRISHDGQGREVVEGFYRDVSDRVEMQAFLNSPTDRILPDSELFEALEKDSRAQMDYLASVGHQIRTPLSSAIGTLENFQLGLEDPESVRGRLPYVVAQLRACSQLVRNLSYMDRILRGGEIRLSPVPLAKLAIETKLDVDALLDAKNLKLQIDGHALDRLLVVEGDRDLLRQVLVNLVDNAIKYSLPGTAITIRAYEWRTGRVLEIANIGLPIPEAERSRLFERGFRSTAAKSAVPNGTGLGLWLAKEILKLHRATIECTQVEEGKGPLTTFRITFPHPSTAHSKGKRR